MLNKYLKKIPSWILAGGASLIFALLGIAGILAYTTVWPLAVATMVLIVIYEFEIYANNIENAFNKLFFAKNYLKNYLAKEFLRNNLDSLSQSNCEFYKDYQALVVALHQFEGKDIDHQEDLTDNDKKELKRKKKFLEESLQNLELLFRQQLFPSKNKNTKDLQLNLGLQAWLQANPVAVQAAQKTLKNRRMQFRGVLVFSALTAVFMTLGTTYLLSEALTIIPFIAAISTSIPPAALIVMAVFAGVAYGYLTYNAVTDMINNKTLSEFRNYLTVIRRDGLSVANLLKTLGIIVIIGLAVALTVCTAGTWWSIAKETVPFFTWLSRIPRAIMGIVHPIVTGFASLFFNLSNTHETLKELREMKEGISDWFHGTFSSNTSFALAPLSDKQIILIKNLDDLKFIKDKIKDSNHKTTRFTKSEIEEIKQKLAIATQNRPTQEITEINQLIKVPDSFFARLRKRENWGQILNIPRLLLNLTVAPLRILLFVTHLLSMAVTGDRIPKLPTIVSIILSFLCEGFEDMHYFLQPEHRHHHHGHKHHDHGHKHHDHGHKHHDHGHAAAAQPTGLPHNHNLELMRERLKPEHGHSHANDFPTRVIKFCFLPLYGLAILWDYIASQFNPGKTSKNPEGKPKLSLSQAFHKYMRRGEGYQNQNQVELHADTLKALAVMQIRNYADTHFQAVVIDKEAAALKRNQLDKLVSHLDESHATTNEEIKNNIRNCAKLDEVTKHRHFFWSRKSAKTSTETMLSELAGDFESFTAPAVV